LSPNIEKISKKLDEINIRHVINWTFKHDEEYVSANKIKPYSFDVDLRINFLGLIFVGKKKLIKKMVLFAIEYDESGKEFRISDYLKQYYLRQMNVHLLRLNNKMNLRKEINRFIKEILDSSTYVVMNGLIKTIKNDVSNKLNIFYENYEYNHNLYYKYYDKKKMEGVEDLKEDNRIEKYGEKPCDEASVVPAGFLESLMDGKYIFSK